MVIEFSSSVVSPSFIHTVSFVVTSLSTFADMLSSDDALRDMLESEMTTTGKTRTRYNQRPSIIWNIYYDATKLLQADKYVVIISN